jgi:hypothetical protein
MQHHRNLPIPATLADVCDPQRPINGLLAGPAAAEDQPSRGR